MTKGVAAKHQGKSNTACSFQWLDENIQGVGNQCTVTVTEFTINVKVKSTFPSNVSN